MRIIFIDNGPTGSIGVYDGKYEYFGLTPAVKQQDYTKEKKNITRIDTLVLAKLLDVYRDGTPTMIVMERPMTTGGPSHRSDASVKAAARAFEATLVICELMGFPVQYSDSKDWQRGLLPSSGKRGVESSVLKQESHDIGVRLFPQCKDLIDKHKDADGILGAYAFWKKENIHEG